MTSDPTVLRASDPVDATSHVHLGMPAQLCDVRLRTASDLRWGIIYFRDEGPEM